MTPDFYKTGATAGILVSEMLHTLAHDVPGAPVMVAGFTTPDRKLGMIELMSDDEPLVWPEGHANPVLVLNYAEESEIAILVPDPSDRVGSAIIYRVQYARGGGKIFTSEPERVIRVWDLDMTKSFRRGFEESIEACKRVNDLSGWGELGAYQTDES